MSVQKTMNIVATTGEYTNNQGEQKKRYLTVGTLFVYDDGGMSIKLDAIPTNFNGSLSIYDKQDRQPQQQMYQQNMANTQAPSYHHQTGMNSPVQHEQVPQQHKGYP